MKWYPVFLREMLLLKKRIFKFGYVFSSVLSPIIFLAAFGLGFGKRMSMGEDGYAAFLIPGIVCMSSMTNSFNQVANSISMGRLFFKNFQTMILSPTPPVSIMLGLLASGIVRGVLTSSVIAAAGYLLFGLFPFTSISLFALILNVALFSCFGIIVGLMVKELENTAIIANFVIMPMAFFSGTFFPLDFLPPVLKNILLLLPLSHTNILIRKESMDQQALVSMIILTAATALFFLLGAKIIRRYSE